MNFTTVVACRNRYPYLTIQSVLKYTTQPIIVVDWSSDERYSIQPFEDRRVTVLRVEDETEWNLGRAYNFGILNARSPFILKLDCDTSVDQPLAFSIPASRWRHRPVACQLVPDALEKKSTGLNHKGR